MSQEATRKQHEGQEPREGENPNRTQRKNPQEHKRNGGKEPVYPSNNPSDDPQHRQERSGTPDRDRGRGNSRDTAGNQSKPAETEKHNKPDSR